MNPNLNSSIASSCRSGSGKSFINRLQALEQEISALKAHCSDLTRRNEELEKWRAFVDDWVYENFAFRISAIPVPENDVQTQQQQGGDGEETDNELDAEQEDDSRGSLSSSRENGTSKRPLEIVELNDTDSSGERTVLITVPSPKRLKESKPADTNSSRSLKVESTSTSTHAHTSKSIKVEQQNDKRTVKVSTISPVHMSPVEVVETRTDCEPNPGTPMTVNQDAPCAVCQEPEEEENNAIIFCDKCSLPVHQACYGVAKIPDGKWFCNPCAKGIDDVKNIQCRFCSIRGGALKPVFSPAKNSWGHVWCAWWIKELRMGSKKTQEPISGLKDIPKSRWALVCSICKIKKGAPFQCYYKKCPTAAHATCAKNAGWTMDMGDAGAEDPIYVFRCKKHPIV